MQVLVIHDQELSTLQCKPLLKQLGHQSFFCQNLDEAKQYYQSQKPSMVIFELQEVCDNHIELVKSFRALGQNIASWKPILYMCHQYDEEQMSSMLDAGCDDFLLLPVNFKLFQSKINAMRKMMAMRANLMDFDIQIREINNKLLVSNQVLSELTWIDHITNLPNVHGFVDNAKKFVKNAARKHEPLALVILEVDCLDLLDDKQHQAKGEQTLLQFAKCLEEAVARPNDYIAHYGRNIFCMLLPETNFLGAETVAKRVKFFIDSQHKLLNEESKEPIAVHIGLAAVFPYIGYDYQELIALADHALFIAKQRGPNHIVKCQFDVDTGENQIEYITVPRSQ